MSLTDEQDERLREILEHLGPIANTLTGSSVGFVADQVKRYEQYGQGIRVSPRQWEWLEDLYEKYGGKPKVAGKMRDDEADPDEPEIDDSIPF